MFVPNSLPAKSIMEFVADAKANPGKVTLSSPGTGSTPHLAGELLKQMAAHEKAHPTPIIKTMAGKPLTDANGKPLPDAMPVGTQPDAVNGTLESVADEIGV